MLHTKKRLGLHPDSQSEIHYGRLVENGWKDGRTRDVQRGESDYPQASTIEPQKSQGGIHAGEQSFHHNRSR